MAGVGSRVKGRSSPFFYLPSPIFRPYGPGYTNRNARAAESKGTVTDEIPFDVVALLVTSPHAPGAARLVVDCRTKLVGVADQESATRFDPASDALNTGGAIPYNVATPYPGTVTTTWLFVIGAFELCQ
jgi:hypothetical protein